MEGILETVAVQKVMERILKTQAEFRELEMRMKLKGFQGVRVN